MEDTTKEKSTVPPIPKRVRTKAETPMVPNSLVIPSMPPVFTPMKNSNNQTRVVCNKAALL